MEKGAPLIIITGSYGSGKTEYAVNLAAATAQSGYPCTLVDLDVVNPYFRSRDVREAFAGEGIQVVAPEGNFSHADLPMLSPRVEGAVKDGSRHVILDVGGDPMGARVLGRYSKAISARGYDMRLVVNTRRPDTRDADMVLSMADAIEKVSRLAIGKIVMNSHLMEWTTPEVIREGVEVAREAAEKRGWKLDRVLVLEGLVGEGELSDLPVRVFVLKKHMLKPWEKKNIPANRI